MYTKDFINAYDLATAQLPTLTTQGRKLLMRNLSTLLCRCSYDDEKNLIFSLIERIHIINIKEEMQNA